MQRASQPMPLTSPPPRVCSPPLHDCAPPRRRHPRFPAPQPTPATPLRHRYPYPTPSPPPPHPHVACALPQPRPPGLRPPRRHPHTAPPTPAAAGAYLRRSCSASRAGRLLRAGRRLSPGPGPAWPSEGHRPPGGCRAGRGLCAAQAGVRRPEEVKERKKERKCVIGRQGEGNAKPDRK